MRGELREAIRRIHSADYHKILSTEKELRRVKRRRLVAWLPGWQTLTRTRASRLTLIVTANVFLTLLVWGAIYYYNAFVGAMAELDRTASLIDSEVERCVNLIPNLTVVSAEYSAHEVVLYEYVSEMRTLLTGQKGRSPAETTPALEKMMGSLLAVSEQYPDLKASRSFEQLMKDWTETENRIATARLGHIQAIRDYNRLRARFPSNYYALIFGMKRRTLYSYDESHAPALDIKEFYSTYLSGRLGKMASFSSGVHAPAQGRPASAPSAPAAAPGASPPASPAVIGQATPAGAGALARN
jgi:LemA protein